MDDFKTIVSSANSCEMCQKLWNLAILFVIARFHQYFLLMKRNETPSVIFTYLEQEWKKKKNWDHIFNGLYQGWLKIHRWAYFFWRSNPKVLCLESWVQQCWVTERYCKHWRNKGLAFFQIVSINWNLFLDDFVWSDIICMVSLHIQQREIITSRHILLCQLKCSLWVPACLRGGLLDECWE